jgi:hypothetical protein
VNISENIAISATFMKMILASFSVMGGAVVDPLDESDAVDMALDDGVEEGGVGGVVWKGAGWPERTHLMSDKGVQTTGEECDAPNASGMCMSRIRARSEAYARSEDRSSSNACTLLDMVALDGVLGGIREARSLCSSSSSGSSVTSSSSSGNGTGEGGGLGRGFSGVFGRKEVVGCELIMAEREPRLRECARAIGSESGGVVAVVVVAVSTETIADRTVFAFGLRGERGGRGGEVEKGGGGEAGVAGSAWPVDSRCDGTPATRRERGISVFWPMLNGAE